MNHTYLCIKKSLFKLLITLTLVHGALSIANAGDLTTNADLSWQMGNSLSGIDREIYLINAQKNGYLKSGDIWFGSYANGALFYQQHKQKSLGNSSKSEITIPDIKLQFSAAINDHLLTFAQVQATNLLGNNQTNNIKVSNAYALYHHQIAQASEFYALAGRKDIDFGRFSNLVTITQDVDLSNLVQKYFQANGNVIGTGILFDGFNGIISWMNGGQTDNTNLYTAHSNQINNFAMNLNYTLGNEQQYLKLGAGYLNGSLATLRRPDAKTNPAYDINISALFNHFEMMAEYASTFYQTEFTGKAGSALTTALAYHFNLNKRPTILAFQYSWANASFIPKDQEAISDQNSYSLEFRQEISHNLWLGTQVNYIVNPVGIIDVDELSARLLAEVVF